MTEVTHLAHKVSAEGIGTDPDLVKAVQEYPTPKTLRDIRAISNLVGYYRHHLPSYAKLETPLSDLLRKDQQCQWGKEQQQAFEAIKKCLTEAPVLAHPDFSKAV